MACRPWSMILQGSILGHHSRSALCTPVQVSHGQQCGHLFWGRAGQSRACNYGHAIPILSPGLLPWKMPPALPHPSAEGTQAPRLPRGNIEKPARGKPLGSPCGVVLSEPLLARSTPRPPWGRLSLCLPLQADWREWEKGFWKFEWPCDHFSTRTFLENITRASEGC